MAPKSSTGPSSFCEWVVGTSIESALGPIPRKPRHRDVVRVEVSTDDESEEDSLKITYPRPRRPRAKKKPASIKKVRFEDAPRKSALKKTTTTVVTSESDAETSSSEATASREASAESSGESSKSSKSRRKRSESESDYDSDPHPTCKCVRCVRGRRWLKNQGKHTAKQRKEVGTDSSDSEVNTAPKSKPQNTGKKGGKKVAVDSEGDGETSESVTRSKEEPEPKKKTGGKKKQKQNKIENAQSVDKKRNKKANADTEESATEGTSAKMKKGKKNGNEGHEAESSTKVKQRDGQKKGDYPEAFPGPHPRRPHYIEPVRAEVVQTERVLETPQDPPPNAYYDAEHNIIRVYHGPVWGGNPNQSLYPRRDSSMRPLPIGMPHLMQNPYYHGFNNPPPQQQPGLENFPVTQGMPMNAWTSMCPPLGFPPGQLGPGMFDREPATNGGAFHQMSGANGRKAPSTMDKDKAGDNNVVPGSIKSGKDNPYNPRAKSAFSAWGSNPPASHRSRQNADAGGDGAGVGANWNATGSTTQDVHPSGGADGSWGKDNTPTNGGAWGNDGKTSWNNNNDDNNNDNNNADNAWGEGTNTANNGQQEDAGGGWDNDGNNDQNEGANSSNNGQADWGNTNGENNDNPANDTWDNASDNSGDAPVIMEDSNVGPTHIMPGAWGPAGASWGDESMAADTGGQVDSTSGSPKW